MPIRTQGTQVYVLDKGGSNPVVLPIGCVTSLGNLTNPREQIDVTCLESNAREFVAGLSTPGVMNVGLNFDPGSATHQRIVEMFQGSETFDIAIGFSDGTAPPTLDSDDEFDLPTSRSWIVYQNVYWQDVPLEFAVNDVVRATAAVQLNGDFTPQWKA